MPVLFGISITDDDARTLVDLLLRVGRASDLSAAASILRGLPSEGFTPAERDALLGVLVDSPDGLAVMRGVLARDHRERSV